MNFINLDNLLCGTEKPWFLWIFDFSTAPALLFYSYIPIIIVSLLVGLYVFINDKKSLQSKLLLSVTVFFVLWVLNVLVQWVASYHTVLMFAWQLTAIFETGIYLSTIYFAYVFLNKTDLSFLGKCGLGVIALIVIFLTPTTLNVSSYDVQNCEGVVGLLWSSLYVVEPAIIVCMIYMGFVAFRKENNISQRKQIVLFTSGLAFFLSIFFLSNFYGELTRVYEFNLWGPIGMVVFLILLAFMIVRFKTFNIKLVGAQALIVSLVVLIGSQFFFIQNDTNRVLTAITLIITGAIGINLIRSVKKEVQQREEIERQEKALEIANVKLKELDQLKSEFVSLATHQIRGPLASIKGYASMMIEGDYGEIPEVMKNPVETIYQSSKSLAVIVDDFLNVSRIEQGKMKYDFSTFDLCALANEVVTEAQPTIEKKGLLVSVTVCPQPANVKGDRGKIKQVIGNLLDNSIKYTPKGNIHVSLDADRGSGKVLLTIKDTGVGIRATTIPYLFQKFSRAEDASKVNILGTGLGLYVAKQMIEAHKGKVWVESEGEGKGSTFFVELKLV